MVIAGKDKKGKEIHKQIWQEVCRSEPDQLTIFFVQLFEPLPMKLKLYNQLKIYLVARAKYNYQIM